MSNDITEVSRESALNATEEKKDSKVVSVLLEANTEGAVTMQAAG